MPPRPSPAPSPRTRLRRLPEKAAYDAATLNAILDAMPLAHVGHLVDGAPVVTPTLQWRQGDRLFWHGSAASRLMRAAAGAEVCVTVTLLDGMVLARSGLEHSVTYRSAMVFGRAEPVTGTAKAAALEEMFDRLFPGRWPQLRPMTAQEAKATAVLSLPLTEATSKVSTGYPEEPEADRDWPVWAGIVPLSMVTGTPEPAPGLAPGLGVPDHAARFRIGQAP